MITANGWGAVNAASIEVVNQSIAKQKKLPQNFLITTQGSLLGIDIFCTISGDKTDKTKLCKWEKWEIVSGGSGEIIHMSCVLGDAYANVEVKGENKSSLYDVSKSDIRVSLNLKAIPDENYHIKEKSGTANKITAEEEKEIQILDSSVINGLDEKKDKPIIDLIKDGFADYFKEHLKEFSAAFGVIMLNGKIAEKKKDFQWLMPTDVSYAFEQTHDNRHYFGLLTMLDNDKITTQSQQIDVGMFENMPKDANSVLLISGEKFCKHVLLPSAVAIITGSKEEDFDIGKDKISVTNNKELNWDKFKLENGSVIQPTIPKGALEVNIDYNFIKIEIVGMHYSPSPGITVYMNLTQKVEVTVEKRKDGSYVLITNNESAFQNNKITTSVEVAKWLKITEIVVEVVSAVAAFACGALAIGGKLASKAATTVVEETVAEFELSEEAISETAQAEIEAASEVIEAAANEVASAATETTSGFFGSNFCKVTEHVCGFIAAAGGVSIGITELVKYLKTKDYDNIPTLNDFANLLLSNYAWPDLKEAKIVGGELMGVLLIYTNIPVD